MKKVVAVALSHPVLQRIGAFLGFALLAFGIATLDRALPRNALASRNSAGTMAAVNGPFIPGTVINSAQINSRYSDIESELTNSLDRNGRGGMLAATRGIDGTVAAPAFSWTSETGTGLYRIGAGNPGFAVSGSKRQEWSTTGTTVTGTLGVSGATTLSSTLATTGTTTSTGIFRAPDGSVSAPGVSFTSEDDGSGTGLYMGAAQSMRVAVNGAEIARFEPTRTLVGVGTSTLQINNGIAADGSGLKHQAHTGCATAASIGATCTDTLTWSSAFASGTVAAYCFCNAVTSGLPIIRSYTDPGNGVSITITTMALTAVAAQCSVIKCLAIPE